MKRTLMTVIIIFMLMITACSKSKEGYKYDVNSLKPGTDIISINGKKFTKGDFDDAFNKLYFSSPFGQSNVDLSQDRNYKIKLLFTAKAVNDLIIRYYIEEEAKKNNITVSDQEVKDIFDEIVQKMGGKERLLTQIKIANMDEDKFRDSLKEDMLAKKVIDSISKNTAVTDDEVKKYYNQHKSDKFDVPETARASHIFIKADARIIKNTYEKENPGVSAAEVNKYVTDVMKEKRAKAEQILKEVLANPDSFNAIAKEKSEDRYSALNNGDIGYFPRGKMLDAINDVVFESGKVQVGKVYNNLIQSPIGFHILKVTDHRKAGILTFDSVKDDIRSTLDDNKKMDVLTEFVKSKKSSARIEYMYKEFDQAYINKQLSMNPDNPANKATADITAKPDDQTRK